MHKPTVTIVHDTRRALSGGSYPVRLQVIFRVMKNGKPTWQPKLFGQGNHCTLKEFETFNAPRSDSMRQLKTRMNALYSKALEIINSNADLTPEDFDSLFQGIARDTVNGVYKIKIDELLTSKPARVSSSRSYESGLHSLQEFVWSKSDKSKIDKLTITLRFPDITVKWLIGYEEWMIETGNSINTIGVYLRNLRHIFNMARGKVRGRGEAKLRLIPLDMYPFDEYQIKEEEKYKIPLNDKELEKLKGFVTKDPLMKEAHDYWMFSYYSNGMNMGDVLRLKKSNVEEEFIYYNRSKIRTTRRKLRPIIIPLNDQLTDIIARRGAPNLDPGRYLFPILEVGLSEEQIKNRIGDFIKRINSGLALIASKLCFNKKFTTVIARHTYANRILNATDGDTRMIQEGLGHSSSKTSEHYKGSLYLEKVKKAREAL